MSTARSTPAQKPRGRMAMARILACVLPIDHGCRSITRRGCRTIVAANQLELETGWQRRFGLQIVEQRDCIDRCGLTRLLDRLLQRLGAAHGFDPVSYTH